jgi:nucleotide-binding universal stress UspA family protein
MSGQIVLGYDGSEGAKAALAEGLALAKALGTSVTLAFGYEAPAFYAGDAGRQRDAIEEIGNTTLEEGLAAAKAIDPSVEVHAETVAGRPAASLIAMAERDHARMIVVGHHGGGTVRGAIMGSVTFKVLHDAPCPVLVVLADS